MDRNGIAYGLAAYVLWGLLPIYWKLLHAVDSIEILMHRMVWSLLFLIVVLALRKRWSWLKSTLRDRRALSIYGGAALLLGLNWGIYIWAVNADFIVETSLGYYINPLVSVGLGMVVFGERLRWGQWAAIGLALVGVLVLTISYGHLPWIALGLAFSFGIYGMLKKKAPLGSFEGLTLETAVLFLPALGYILFVQANGQGALGKVDLITHGLLILTGVVTAIPLLLFSAAARRIPLTWIGIIQYIAPSMGVVIGVIIYNEPFGPGRQIGFFIIWAALITFTTENILFSRRMRARRVGG